MSLLRRYLRYLRWKAKHYLLWRKLPNKLAKQWLRTLVMHPERQGRGMLRTQGGQMCCLGQLCDIVDPKRWINGGHDEYHWMFSWEGCTTSLPESVKHEIGFRSSCGVFQCQPPKGHFGNGSLACLNDAGMTWPEIATFIVTRQDELFE